MNFDDTVRKARVVGDVSLQKYLSDNDALEIRGCLSENTITRFNRRSNDGSIDEWLGKWADAHSRRPMRTTIEVSGAVDEDCLNSIKTQIDSISRWFKTTADWSYVLGGNNSMSQRNKWLIDDFDRLDDDDDTYPEYLLSGTSPSGRRLTRVFARWLKDLRSMGVDDETSNDLEYLEGIVNRYAEFVRDYEKLQTQTHKVLVTSEPCAFMRLGHQICDTGSCYRMGGEFNYAPLHLATSKGSFVIYIKGDRKNDDGELSECVLARAWGAMLEDGKFFFSNIYCSSSGMNVRLCRVIMKNALERLSKLHGCDEKAKSKRNPSSNGFQYWNGDAYGNDYISNIFAPTWTGHGCECGYCGEMAACRSMTWTATHGDVCDHCVDDFVYIENRGEYYYIDDCVRCDYNDEYILDNDAVALWNGGTCYYESAVEMFDGQYCMPDEAIAIEGGEHEGEYCSRECHQERIIINKDEVLTIE